MYWDFYKFSNSEDGQAKMMLSKKKKSKHCTEGILTSQMKNRCLKLKHINYLSLKISYIFVMKIYHSRLNKTDFENLHICVFS